MSQRCLPESWLYASSTQNVIFVSESSVYRLLKAHDLITSPAYIVMKAEAEADRGSAVNAYLGLLTEVITLVFASTS